jgi:cytochrome bd-type quinol oxidase subunit 2
MWRVAMFAIYPASFFILMGEVVIPVTCVLIGLARRSALEMLGWSLLGLIVVLTLFAG